MCKVRKRRGSQWKTLARWVLKEGDCLSTWSRHQNQGSDCRHRAKTTGEVLFESKTEDTDGFQ